MSERWPRVKLGEVLTLRRDPEKVEPDRAYRFAGVYCFGRGLFSSGTKTGAEFKYATVTRLHETDLVYPKLMAWEGAIGVVSKAQEDHVVSPEFPVFSVDGTKIDPGYLDLVVRGATFQRQLMGIKSAGTNVRRKRIYPDGLLRMEIPLPPIEVQRRVSAQAKTIHLVREACETQRAELNLLRRSIVAHHADNDVPRVKLREVMTQVVREVGVEPAAQYRGAGVLSYTNGLFSKGMFYGSETEYPMMYRVKSGDFVYSRLFAWEGAFALADESFDGVVMSQEFPMFNVDSARVDPQWLLLNVGREQFWRSLGSSGLGQRRKRVQPENLLASDIPLPPIEVQREVVRKVQAVRAVMDEIKRQQNDLDALLHALVSETHSS